RNYAKKPGLWEAIISKVFRAWPFSRSHTLWISHMRVIRSVTAMQRLARAWRSKPNLIGLVPTMGYLHAGHLSLMRRARKAIGKRGKLVVSIYVNPTQFGPTEDFARYPRDLARDFQLCRKEGVDVVFSPSDQQMYPAASARTFSTYVV